MHAWRIAKRSHALDRSGRGAALRGGRWNSPNFPAIYAGLTPEIAALEKLVHAGTALPGDLVLARLDLPDDEALYTRLSSEDLPKGWNELPSSPAAAAFGDDFIAKGERLGLIVPSAVVPEAWNILINPDHRRMADLSMTIMRAFSFDPRFRP